MKNKYALIGVIAAVIGVCLLTVGIMGFVEERRAGREYEELLQQAGDEESVENSDEGTVQEDNKNPISSREDSDGIGADIGKEPAEGKENGSGTEAAAGSEGTSGKEFVTRDDIDFEELQALNPDIYAWIEVPGTNVDYPIVQHATDNSYYLTHTIEHKKTTAASIYTENYNSKDFSDHHTVIYGHNMKNGTMFRTLHNFEDYDFFEEHRDIIIYMPDETKYYKIFAAYTYDNRHLLHFYYCEEAESFQKYLDDIYAIKDFDAFIDREVEVTSEDHIITLSTCVNSGEMTQRYLVQAVLIN